MPKYTTKDIRNIALFGHAGAGKTTLAEAILNVTGKIGEPGEVERGTTTSDYTDEEKQRGHSLYCTALHTDHAGKHINILDTPGHPDFIGHAFQALAAVEMAAIVIDASHGIEAVTRRLMDRSSQAKLCRMVIVNKIDAEHADTEQVLAKIQEVFGSTCLPVNLPANNATEVVDCFFNQDGGDSDLGSIADAHTAIVDQVVEVDDQLMEIYLEKGEVDPALLHDAFDKALREGHLIPVCFTSARCHDDHTKTVGVEQLLDLIVKLAPNPAEGNPRPFTFGEGDDAEPMVPVADPDKPVVAHIFQVIADPFVGKLSAFRVHQGTVDSSRQIIIADAKKGIKLNHIFKLNGKTHVEVDSAIPGDIAAVAKTEEANRDLVMHESHEYDSIHIKPRQYPKPMSGLAITAKKRGDEQKISDGLNKITAEDPTFSVTHDNITKETVIHAMGEQHMRMILEKLKNRYNVEVDTKPPKIPYRESIMGKAEGHHRHKKQTGGAGQFGEVYLRIEPNERGAGFEFSNDIFGGSIPSSYIPAVEKGIRRVLDEGAIAGYPLQDVKVSVYDGKHHPVDSKEVAFVAAGRRAFIEAISKAKPVLLEPCVSIEVTIPNQYVGEITSDLSGKRGRIQGTDMLSDLALVSAIVPLAEVANYQNQLKSVTGGQGSFTMEFSHYDQVPSNIQQQVIAAYNPKHEED